VSNSHVFQHSFPRPPGGLEHKIAKSWVEKRTITPPPKKKNHTLTACGGPGVTTGSPRTHGRGPPGGERGRLCGRQRREGGERPRERERRRRSGGGRRGRARELRRCAGAKTKHGCPALLPAEEGEGEIPLFGGAGCLLLSSLASCCWLLPEEREKSTFVLQLSRKFIFVP
jgi:hypothetical protein